MTVRTEEEINAVIADAEEVINLLTADPMKLVRITGGNVPLVVSSVQVLITQDAANSTKNILAWAKGEDNAVPATLKALREKLTGA
jgi:hypothetical protein